MKEPKPTRCIDPVIKYCQGCQYGHCIYPEWVETAEDLAYCTFETVCFYGFDEGRPEDEPTEEELAEFEKYLEKLRENELQKNPEEIREFLRQGQTCNTPHQTF